MFDKFKRWATKSDKTPDAVTQGPPASDDIPDPENLEFCFSYVLDKDDQIYIDVSTSSSKYSTYDLASLLQYISSLQGQLDTLGVLKQGMDSKDHESFLGHFLALKTKEAEMVSSTMETEETEETEEISETEDISPCVSPLDMI